MKKSDAFFLFGLIFLILSLMIYINMFAAMDQNEDNLRRSAIACNDGYEVNCVYFSVVGETILTRETIGFVFICVALVLLLTGASFKIGEE